MTRRPLVRGAVLGLHGCQGASGLPQVVCPFTADQPFWAQRAYALGVASVPVPQRRLNAETLALPLAAVLAAREIGATAPGQ